MVWINPPALRRLTSVSRRVDVWTCVFVVNHSSGADVDLLGYLSIFRHVYASVQSTAVAGGPSLCPIAMSIISKERLEGNLLKFGTDVQDELTQF